MSTPQPAAAPEEMTLVCDDATPPRRRKGKASRTKAAAKAKAATPPPSSPSPPPASPAQAPEPAAETVLVEDEVDAIIQPAAAVVIAEEEEEEAPVVEKAKTPTITAKVAADVLGVIFAKSPPAVEVEEEAAPAVPLVATKKPKAPAARPLKPQTPTFTTGLQPKRAPKASAAATEAPVVVARAVTVCVQVCYGDGEEQRGVFHCFNTQTTEKELLEHVLRQVADEVLERVSQVVVSQTGGNTDTRLPWLTNAHAGKYIF